jgi:hypothetical protein
MTRHYELGNINYKQDRMFRNEEDGTCLNVWRSTNGGGHERWADIAFWPIVAWTMNCFLFCFLVTFYSIVIGYEDLFGDLVTLCLGVLVP